jgi:hypothetical protein
MVSLSLIIYQFLTRLIQKTRSHEKCILRINMWNFKTQNNEMVYKYEKINIIIINSGAVLFPLFWSDYAL